jgi:small redox-active disulfide protein 2
MKVIKVLGTGCPKCKYFENAVKEVVAQEGIEATISKVDDIMEIMRYGVMATPALVVDEKVVLKGKVPTNEELKKLLIP